jgi:16S rRNA processing protein RimM
VAEAWDALVLVGRIARPHGHRGAVIVKAETDFPEVRFAPGATVWIERAGVPAEVTIVDARFHNGRPIVTFEGVGSMNDAELLRGAELRVPEGALQGLPEGAFYHFQLIGCEVTTIGGDRVGTVRAVEGDAGNHRLSITSESGEVLVPLVTSICVSIDVVAKRIVIDPPAGLLDVNRRSAGGAAQ